MEKRPTSKHLIRFPDCDPFGHLNNARFIDYMVNAREDHVREEYNLHVYQDALKNGKGWVTGTNKIAYLREAKLMQTVTITSHVIEFSSKYLQVEIVMLDEAAEQIKAVLWATFVHLDLKTGRSTEHDQKIAELLDNVLDPIVHRNFDERVAFIKDGGKLF